MDNGRDDPRGLPESHGQTPQTMVKARIGRKAMVNCQIPAFLTEFGWFSRFSGDSASTGSTRLESA